MPIKSKRKASKLSPWKPISKLQPVVLPKYADEFLSLYNHPVTYRSCRLALANFQRFAVDNGLVNPRIERAFPVTFNKLQISSLADFYNWLRRYRFSTATIKRQLNIVGKYLLWLRENGYLPRGSENKLAKMMRELEEVSGWRSFAAILVPLYGDRFCRKFKNVDTRRSARTALISFQEFAKDTGLISVWVPLSPEKLGGDALVKYYYWMRRKKYSPRTIDRHIIYTSQYLRWFVTFDQQSKRLKPKLVQMLGNLAQEKPMALNRQLKGIL